MSRSLAGLVLVAALIIPARSALPCSPPQQGFYGFRPAENAKIPKNTVIALDTWDIFNPSVNVFEFDFGIPVTPNVVSSQFLLVPLAGISGGGPIEVAIQEPDGPRHVIDYLETDTAEDLTPPTFDPEIIDVSYEYVVNTGGLCHPDGFLLWMTFDPASDDTGIGYYSLQERLGSSRSRLATVLSPEDASGRPTIGGYIGSQSGLRCFDLIAHDWAGNSTAVETRGDGLCFAFRPNDTDAGPGPDYGWPDLGSPDLGMRDLGVRDTGVFDGGIPDLGGARDLGGSSGAGLATADPSCGCRETSRGSTSLAPMLVWLLLLARRRRR